MPSPDERRAPSLAEAIIPVASLIILVGLSFYLFGDAGAGGPNQVALIVATMVAVLLAWRRGYTLDELARGGRRQRRAPAWARSSSCSPSAR